MSDSSDERAHTREESGDATEREGVEELRRRVEEKYDFYIARPYSV